MFVCSQTTQQLSNIDLWLSRVWHKCMLSCLHKVLLHFLPSVTDNLIFHFSSFTCSFHVWTSLASLYSINALIGFRNKQTNKNISKAHLIISLEILLYRTWIGFTFSSWSHYLICGFSFLGSTMFQIMKRDQIL